MLLNYYDLIKNKLKEIIIPYFGVIHRQLLLQNRTESEILEECLNFDNFYSVTHHQFIIYLLLTNLFQKPRYFNECDIDSTTDTLSKLEYHQRLLEQNSIISKIGSLITYKNKINKLLLEKPSNINKALDYLAKKYNLFSILEIGFNLGFGAVLF